jgi:hypothetical protein
VLGRNGAAEGARAEGLAPALRGEGRQVGLALHRLQLRHARRPRHRAAARRLAEEDEGGAPVSGANGVAYLEKRFRGCGYVFRCFPDARFDWLKFQAGRTVEETAIVPAHIGTGSRRYELTVKKFHLLVYGGHSRGAGRTPVEKCCAATLPRASHVIFLSGQLCKKADRVR